MGLRNRELHEILHFEFCTLTIRPIMQSVYVIPQQHRLTIHAGTTKAQK